MTISYGGLYFLLYFSISYERLYFIRPFDDHIGLWNIFSPCNLSRRQVWFFKKCNKVLFLRRLSHYQRLYWLFLLGSELWNVGRRRLWLSLLFLSSFDNCAFIVWGGSLGINFLLFASHIPLKNFKSIGFITFSGFGFGLKCSLTLSAVLRSHSSILRSQGLIGASLVFSSFPSSLEAP